MNKLIACVLILLSVTTYIYAAKLSLKQNSDLVGMFDEIEIHGDQTLNDIAREFDIGPWELRLMNPHAKTREVLDVGQKITLPGRFILPKKREGIVINLAQRRLYFFDKDENTVDTFPIGIARPGAVLALGEHKIVRKKEGPSWRPTKGIREYMEKRGKPVPDIVPPGEDNPLGMHALYLDRPNIIIHGTNNPRTIGWRVSSGCFRMYPEDIEYLFSKVEPGTPVSVINEPVSFGFEDDKLFAKIFPPMAEDKTTLESLYTAGLKEVEAKHSLAGREIIDAQELGDSISYLVPNVVAKITETDLMKSLLPFNSRRGLRANIIDNSADAVDLVDNSVRD